MGEQINPLDALVVVAFSVAAWCLLRGGGPARRSGGGEADRKRIDRDNWRMMTGSEQRQHVDREVRDLCGNVPRSWFTKDELRAKERQARKNLGVD